MHAHTCTTTTCSATHVFFRFVSVCIRFSKISACPRIWIISKFFSAPAELLTQSLPTPSAPSTHTRFCPHQLYTTIVHAYHISDCEIILFNTSLSFSCWVLSSASHRPLSPSTALHYSKSTFNMCICKIVPSFRDSISCIFQHTQLHMQQCQHNFNCNLIMIMITLDPFEIFCQWIMIRTEVDNDYHAFDCNWSICNWYLNCLVWKCIAMG